MSWGWLMQALFDRRPRQALDESQQASEVAAARARWIEINEAARLAGCKCGRPGTVVRRFGGTVGGVPAEVWSCEEHKDVSRWQRTGDGPWEPSGDYSDAEKAWEV